MNNKSAKLNAWLAIAFCAFATFQLTKNVIAAFLVAFVLAALLTPLKTLELLRANTVDSELNLNTILDSALRAFKAAVIPLTAFATIFRDVVLKGTNKVEVPYFPLVSAASKDFDTCYVFDDSYAQDKREITINKRKYQSLLITGTEIARYPQLKLEQIGALYGEKLAYDVLQDIFSVVTAANFGAAAFTGAASTFDSDDATDLAGVADLVPWPKAGRSMIVYPTYKTNLFKDGDVRLEYAYGDAGVIRDDVLPKVAGFQFASTPAIPGNSENLVGFIAYMSAILSAFSPIEPPPNARKLMSEYRVVTDPDTDISIEYRAWGDPDCDADKHIIECNYGYAKGEANALKRMISA
jgi:hypothetical protein